MEATGYHIIAELSHCNPEVLGDVAQVRDIMVQAAWKARAEVREVAFHKFSPQGVSGVVVIAESHLSIHTWPECGYAAIDIYTCGDSTDPWAACRYLAEAFKAGDVATMELKRGVPLSSGSFGHQVFGSLLQVKEGAAELAASA